jgi:formylglycine-generating enzyme required for sulfatase activity
VTATRTKLAVIPLIVVLLAAITSAPAHAEKRVALVIGNDRYQNLPAERQLQTAVNDAQAVGVAFARLGFNVIGGTNLGRQAMIDKLAELTARLEPGDTAALFYAGHGVAIDGVNYLVPSDVPAVTPGAEARVRGASISEPDIIAELQRRAVRVALMVIDACRDNPFPRPGTRAIGNTRGLVASTPARGIFVIYSAGGGQKALDRLEPQDRNPNSVFTRVFVQEVQRPGLDLGSLAVEVREKVAALALEAKDESGAPDPYEQTPAYYHQTIGGRIFLAGRSGGEGTTEVPAAQTGAEMAAQAWAATKDTTSIAVLEDFIRQFGSTVYGSMARARLEELKKSQAAALTSPPAATPERRRSAEAAPGARPSAWSATPTADEVFWLTIREASAPALFDGFLKKFPASAHVPEARARLEELKKSQATALTSPPAATPERRRPAEAATQEALVAPPVPAPSTQTNTPCGGKTVSVSLASRPSCPLSEAEERGLKPKDVFKECGTCPEMVVVPAGSFTMGSPASKDWVPEEGAASDQQPQHRVTLARPFAVGKFSVTFDEWDACVADGGCNGYRPSDQSWGRGRRPVVNVSWSDAQVYVRWLSRKTGKTYRLLSESEREYVTRAGTTTPFWWGSSISTQQANYDGSYDRQAQSEYQHKTVPVDSFAANPWGLYQVHGNVWEWTDDCYHDSYSGAPADGSAWTSGDCSERVLRGGSWFDSPQSLRGVIRGASNDTGFRRSVYLGFRVARMLIAPWASPRRAGTPSPQAAPPPQAAAPATRSPLDLLFGSHN